jgi:hypothetical protein
MHNRGRNRRNQEPTTEGDLINPELGFQCILHLSIHSFVASFFAGIYMYISLPIFMKLTF